jgi:VWFA-related protein
LEIAVRLSHLTCVPVIALALSAPLLAQAPAAPLPATGTQEKVQVTVVQVEALVMDKTGKTVPGLTKDDFMMTIGGLPVAITTVDVDCSAGAMADPVPLKNGQELPAPIAPGTKRRVIFAFDYTFLSVTMRPQVLDAAEYMLRMSKTPEEEVMIVALTSEVRVEQKFTSDIRQLVATLSRMKHDATLWPRDFPIGSTGASYFKNIATMMDVAGSYDGAKAVVYFSQAGLVGASMVDIYHENVAAHATAARTAMYPNQPDLISSAGGAGETLVRFANETGGRMQILGNDITLPYRRAQRDLSCRYTVAARVDPQQQVDPQTLSVKLKTKGLTIRTPEQIQVFTDEAKALARAGAAFVDPGPFERPLVRAFGFSAIPAGADKWDTILAVNFPAPVGPQGGDVNVRAVVRQDNQAVKEYKRTIHVDPPAGGATSRPVTLLGNTPLKSGQYDLTVVLTDPKGGELVSASTDFVVPQVIDQLLLLRGPVMGRVVPGGMFLRGNPKENAENTRLGKVLGPGNGFEPLIVQELETKDTLIFYWSACVSGQNPLGDDVVVARTLTNAKGESAYAYTPVPLKLQSMGKDIACLDMLETLPPGKLASGDYHLNVTVTQPNGDVIATGTQPLTVK